MKTNEKIKFEIEHLQQTIDVFKHLVEYEPVSIGSKDLMQSHIELCQLKIQGLQSEVLSNSIYNICNPLNSPAHV